MTLSSFAILLQIFSTITFCTYIRANAVTDEQDVRAREIERLTALGMDEPELFYNLTHTENFESECYMTEEIADFYKDFYYVNETKSSAREELVIKAYVTTYAYHHMSQQLSFEDHFAIYHYTMRGFERIKNDTDEGRRMRNAFYRLAIVQSKNPEKYCNSVLFRGQSENKTWYEKNFSAEKKEHQLDRFTSTSPDKRVAKNYGMLRKNETGKTSTLYDMHFPRPYLCANINNITQFVFEKETVLLPETKFFINETIWNKNDSFIDLFIKVTHNDESMTLFDQQKKIMTELKKLKETGTQFYVKCDKPTDPYDITIRRLTGETPVNSRLFQN